MKQKLEGLNQSPEKEERMKTRALEKARYSLKFLETPAQRLLETLRPKIEKREYDSILGDDADARIHTLVMSKTIQELYGDDKKIRTVFVQGGSTLRSKETLQREMRESQLTSSLRKKIHSGEIVKIHDAEETGDENVYLWKEPSTHSDEVRQYLERMKPLLGSKTLLVTEEVYSGSSTDILIGHLHSLGIEVDVVSFGVAESDGLDNLTDYLLTTPKGFPIRLGSHGTGNIVDGSEGVQSRSRSGRGHTLRQYADDRGPNQERVIASRKAAKELSHSLAQHYLAKEK